MITVATVSPFHERLLSLLLADVMSGGGVRLLGYDGEDAARPVARQLLMLRRQPVVFAIDSDTVDTGRVAQHQRDLDDYFAWGAGGLPFQVVQFVPTLEVIFFDRPAVLERLIGRKLEPVLKIAGEIAPRAVLERGVPELAERKLVDRLDQLTPKDLRALRTHPSIAAIREFVQANAESEPLRRTA